MDVSTANSLCFTYMKMKSSGIIEYGELMGVSSCNSYQLQVKLVLQTDKDKVGFTLAHEADLQLAMIEFFAPRVSTPPEIKDMTISENVNDEIEVTFGVSTVQHLNGTADKSTLDALLVAKGLPPGDFIALPDVITFTDEDLQKLGTEMNAQIGRPLLIGLISLGGIVFLCVIVGIILCVKHGCCSGRKGSEFAAVAAVEQ